MRKKINQLAKGITEEKRPLVRFADAALELFLGCGQEGSGELVFSSANGVPFRGLAYADDDRIEIPQNAFAGLSVSLPFVVHGESIAEDTLLEGSFSLVTNAGDLSLPYHIHFGQLLSSSGSSSPPTAAFSAASAFLYPSRNRS